MSRPKTLRELAKKQNSVHRMITNFDGDIPAPDEVSDSAILIGELSLLLGKEKENLSKEEMQKRINELDDAIERLDSHLGFLSSEILWFITRPIIAEGVSGPDETSPLGRARTNMDTHYERIRHTVGQYDNMARLSVDKDGWHAYGNLIRDAYRRQKITFKREDFSKDSSPIVLQTMAVMDEIIRREFNKLDDPFSVEALTRSDVLNEFFSSMMRDTRLDKAAFNEQINTQVSNTWQRLCHEKCGKQVYEVSPGLAEKLRYTKLRGLKTSDLSLPHRSIYIQVPPGTGMQLWNRDTGWHEVEGIYITEDRAEGERTWRFLVIGSPKGNDRFDDALFFFHVPLPEDLSLDEAIDRERARDKTERKELAKSWGPLLDSWPDLFRWALNVVMYATWPEAEFESVMSNKEARQLWERIQKLRKEAPKSKKLDGLRSKYKELDPQHRIILGRSVRLMDVRKTMEERSRKLTVRTLVQGHWMRFAVGEGRKERRWQFREPFWRGPKEGPTRDGTKHTLV